MANLNTLGTTNANVIAQEALKHLVATLPVLGQIASDHSAENAKFGETVIVHEVSAATAINFDPAVGYVPAAKTLVDIPVVLNRHVHHTYGVSVQEASSSRVDLIQRLALGAAHSVGSSIVSAICALVTKANFANETVVALGAGEDGFTRKGLVKLGTALSKRSVPSIGRFALLNPDYFGSLSMDDTLVTLLALSGQKTALDGNLPLIHGIKPSEYVDLPANGGNLVGFAGIRTALGFATRLPDDPGQGQSNINISTVTDEESGISLQVREWYEPTPAEFRRSYTLMFGVGVGQSAALQRLVDKASA